MILTRFAISDPDKHWGYLLIYSLIVNSPYETLRNSVCALHKTNNSTTIHFKGYFPKHSAIGIALLKLLSLPLSSIQQVKPEAT